VIAPALAKRLDISILPLTVCIDNKEYTNGEDIAAEELLLGMGSRHLRPRVVGPRSDRFREVYSQITRHTDQIISLHSPASLSPIVREARIASQEFLGRCDIVVIDSETLSLGLGLLCQEAARLAQESVELTDIVRHIRGMMRHIYIVLITDTLDYLEHSRLISPAQAILGTMLDIKPFLEIEEGQIIPMEKVRSRDRAVDKLAEFASEFTTIDQLAILQSTPYATDNTKMLRERLESIAPGMEYPILLYGPLLASHIGPNAMGLVVYEGMGREMLL
jgi:DegV family protein with EDD domain